MDNLQLPGALDPNLKSRKRLRRSSKTAVYEGETIEHGGFSALKFIFERVYGTQVARTLLVQREHHQSIHLVALQPEARLGEAQRPCGG